MFNSLLDKQGDSRPKLAYVSPLPPERSGIADYSAKLLVELIYHYDIVVITDQSVVSDPWISENCELRSVAWFEENHRFVERVLYHVGNSGYHKHMFKLISTIPGVVFLHDFFLSGAQFSREHEGNEAHAWAKSLYESHGYQAMGERYSIEDSSSVAWRYPSNRGPLSEAIGVLVHSKHARDLGKIWYGEEFVSHWQVVPMLAEPRFKFDRSEARRQLGLSEDTCVICSFGLLGPTKLNHRLLEAWLDSVLYDRSEYLLIFVGEAPGAYGEELLARIQKDPRLSNVKITGWADRNTYLKYLEAADVAVQLRTLSRGESSAATFDCLSHGVPTVLNANGSMAEFPKDLVYMLSDEFETAELTQALETICHNAPLRKALSQRAKEFILTQRTPAICASQYYNSIELLYQRFQEQRVPHPKIINAEKFREKTLFVDISATARFDLKTGIERVARSILLALLKSPPEGYRVEPVYLSDEGGVWHYRLARNYVFRLLQCPVIIMEDEVAVPRRGDVLLGVDISGGMLTESYRAGLFAQWQECGVSLNFIVYDLLPLTMPKVFPPGTEVHHGRWIDVVSRFDRAVCISKAVAKDLERWCHEHKTKSGEGQCQIEWFHLGADIDNSAPTKGVSEESRRLFTEMENRLTFIMVGTIEPRKGHLQTLAAFEQLWAFGYDINLVIVGKEGWVQIPDERMRRTIPETVRRIRTHGELGKRLFWLENASDETLEEIYQRADCLIAATYGEGFGLPLIEAAEYEVPIIARDLAVFKEVAGDGAFYFDGKNPSALADAIETWIGLFETNQHPRSVGVTLQTWEESARQLLSRILPSRDEFNEIQRDSEMSGVAP